MIKPERTSERSASGGRAPGLGSSGRWGPSRTIRVEPIHDVKLGRRLAGVAVDAADSAGSNLIDPPPSPERSQPEFLAVPDLIEPVIGFRIFRAMGARLRSPYVRVFWDEPTLHAACGRRDSGSHHFAPDPTCDCGIYAAFRPELDFARIDYRGVVGIVSLWGRIEVHRLGMRAENARVEALSVYSRWHRRQKRAVATIAEELGVELVALEEIECAAGRYGRRLPAALHLGGSTRRPEAGRHLAQLTSAAS